MDELFIATALALFLFLGAMALIPSTDPDDSGNIAEMLDEGAISE